MANRESVIASLKNLIEESEKKGITSSILLENEVYDYNENLYKILKVNENATQEKITQNFRELAKILHPDKGGNSDEFNELVIAYRILGNKRRREIYDNKYSKKHNELKNIDKIK